MSHASDRTFEPGELYTDGPAWRAAEAAGHDMSLIREALRVPVIERLRTNDSALSLALMLRQAVRRVDDRPAQTSRPAH